MSTQRIALNPEFVRRRRSSLGMTQEQFAEVSGYSVRTIQRIECPGYNTSEDVVRNVAQTLKCLPEELLLSDLAYEECARCDDDGATESQGLPPSASDAELERVVRAERIATLQPYTEKSAPQLFTAQRFQNVLTRFRRHHCKEFTVRGTVVQQVAATEVEARCLGSEWGIAARYLVQREVAPGVPFRVTVYAGTEEHGDVFEDALCTYGSVTVHVRVVTALARCEGAPPGNDATVSEMPANDQGLCRFAFFGWDRPLPFALAVRRVHLSGRDFPIPDRAG